MPPQAAPHQAVQTAAYSIRSTVHESDEMKKRRHSKKHATLQTIVRQRRASGHATRERLKKHWRYIRINATTNIARDLCLQVRLGVSAFEENNIFIAQPFELPPRSAKRYQQNYRKTNGVSHTRTLTTSHPIPPPIASHRPSHPMNHSPCAWPIQRYVKEVTQFSRTNSAGTPG